MEIQNFGQYYKTISNAELLSILENPSGYQALAVEAAKSELANRKLSDSQIQEAKETLIASQIHTEIQKARAKAIEEKVKSTGFNLLKALNTIHPENLAPEKIIRSISIVFILIFLYSAFKERYYLIAYFEDFMSYPIIALWMFFPIVLFPISILTFIRKKRIGWMLFTIYLVFSEVDTFWYFVKSISRRTSNFGRLEQLLPSTFSSRYLFELLFLTGTIYVISQKNIREVYSVNKELMSKCLVMTATLTFLLHFF